MDADDGGSMSTIMGNEFLVPAMTPATTHDDSFDMHSLNRIQMHKKFATSKRRGKLAKHKTNTLDISSVNERETTDNNIEENEMDDDTEDLERVDLNTTVRRHDKMAARAFFYHLAGMGIDAWDYTNPTEPSNEILHSCAEAVARLTCYTYFPKADREIEYGVISSHQRPCSSSCENYLKACNVECCDEGVQCSWGPPNTKLTQTSTGHKIYLHNGYADTDDSSCTGAGSDRRAGFGSGATAAIPMSMAVIVLWAGLLYTTSGII